MTLTGDRKYDDAMNAWLEQARNEPRASPAPSPPDEGTAEVTPEWKEIIDNATTTMLVNAAAWEAMVEKAHEAYVDPSPFHTAVHAVYDEARELLLRKHADYGPKNISGSPGGPLNGLRVRMWDKIARINNLADSGAEPENESLRDSFIDLLNYSAIALLVLDGAWPE